MTHHKHLYLRPCCCGTTTTHGMWRQHPKNTVAVTAASTPLQQQQVLQNSINNREYRPRAASLTRSHKNRGTASALQHDTVVGSESQHRQLQMPEPNIHSHRYAYAQKSLQNGHCQSRRNLVRYHLSQQWRCVERGSMVNTSRIGWLRQ